MPTEHGIHHVDDGFAFEWLAQERRIGLPPGFPFPKSGATCGHIAPSSSAYAISSLARRTPGERRAFAPVAMEGTGETDSPPEETGFELLVPRAKGLVPRDQPDRPFLQSRNSRVSRTRRRRMRDSNPRSLSERKRFQFLR